MILGMGSDLCAIDRISRLRDRFGQRFLDRFFTPVEQEKALRAKSRAGSVLAKRFAAKEAFAKALGTGMGVHCRWAEVGVDNDSRGRPCLCISGVTARTLEAMAPPGNRVCVHLSLSDEAGLAQAVVILSAVPLGHLA